MRELDVLLAQYLDRGWPTAPEGERLAFLELLELPDPDLALYLLGHVPSPEPLRSIVARLRGE